MKAYHAFGPSASGSATKTAVTVIGATTVRPRVYDLTVGSETTPADQTAQVGVNRFTAAGTAGSAFTPVPLDPADVAALATSGITHSAEPTARAGPLAYPDTAA